MVTCGSMAVISTCTGPAGTGVGRVTVLVPAASGGGTAASTTVSPACRRTAVTGEWSPPSWVICERLDRRRRRQVERRTDGAREGRLPRRRRVAVGGRPPGRPTTRRRGGSTPADRRCPGDRPARRRSARWSRRTVTAGSRVRAAGSSTSRTIVGSGSERHRSVGRVRSRVSTNDTGASPAARSAATASDGGFTTSSVGGEAGVDLREADRGQRRADRGPRRARRRRRS